MELKKKVAYKYNIVLLAIVLFVVYMVFQTVTIAVNKKSRLKFVSSVPAEYKNLFVQNDANISDASSYILYHTDFSPISYFDYNDQQWVVVTKFRISERLDSIPNINIKYGETELTEGDVYAGFDRGYYHVDILPESNMIKAINLTVNGVTKSNVRENKNLKIFNFNLKSVSLCYDDLQRNDLQIETSANSSMASVILFKQRESLYFIFITQADPAKRAKSFDLKRILKMQ